MIQTETSKAKILLVEVPNDVFRYRLSTIGARLIYESKSKGIDYSELPEGNWTILNTLDEVTDDESAMVVEMGSYHNTFKNYITNDTHKSNQLRTAKQSLQSLATSLGIEGKTIILYELKN